MTAQHFAERNLRVLQACDALEEHGQLDKSDEEAPHSADLRRLDFKLNLLLDLAGQLLAQSQPRRGRSRFASTQWARVSPTTKVWRRRVRRTRVMLRDIVVQPRIFRRKSCRARRGSDARAFSLAR